MIRKELEWPNHPKIYEINTWPWLYDLSDRYNYPITLENVPKEIIDAEIKILDVISKNEDLREIVIDEVNNIEDNKEEISIAISGMIPQNLKK